MFTLKKPKMLPEKAKCLNEEFRTLSKARNRKTRKGSWRTAGDFHASFRYASQGLAYAFRTQRNFRIHVFVGAVVCALGLWLQLNAYELAILVVTIASILVLELINTAIEAVTDLSIGRRFHPLARIAKDCAAAAVLVASISSLLIGSLLLLPPFLIRIGL